MYERLAVLPPDGPEERPPRPAQPGGLPEGFPDDLYIPDTPATPGNWRTWQSKRREWARREYFEEIPRSSGPSQPQGITVRNADSGMDIRIGAAGINETLVGSDGTLHEDRQRILANLVELLETAVLYQTAPDTKGRGVDCYHSFLAALNCGGQVRAARLVVRQSPSGTYFYAGSVPSRLAGIPVLPPGGGSPISGQAVPIAQLVQRVHYYNEMRGDMTGPAILGSSWSGLGARLRWHGKAAQAQPGGPTGRAGDDFGERLLADWDKHCVAAAEAGRHPNMFPGEAFIIGQMEVLVLRGGLPEAQRLAVEDILAEDRRLNAAGTMIGGFEYASIASGQRRGRILAASEGRSPREHPEYAEWIENAGLIRERGLTILADERTGIVMTGCEGYREWVEGQVGRMEEYLREDAVRIEADAVRERWDAFRSAAEAEGVGPAYKDGFAELSRLAEGTASRADLPADMRGPVGAVLTAMFEERRTAALQWRNLIIREADMKDRSRLTHDGYPDWERYCLRLEAAGTAILDHARAAELPDRDGALARIREAVETAAAWRGEAEGQDRYVRVRRDWEHTWRDVAAEGGHILSLPQEEYVNIIGPVNDLARRTDLPALAREWADDVREEIASYNRAAQAVSGWEVAMRSAMGRSAAMRREALEGGFPVCEHPNWAQWDRDLEDLAPRLEELRGGRATAAGLARDGGDARADERIGRLHERRGEDIAEWRRVRAEREAREQIREMTQGLSQGRGMGF